MIRLRPILLSIGSGILFFLSVAKFDLWPPAWVAFVPLLLPLRTVTPRRAFFLGWLTGAVLTIGGFYWIAGLLDRFGHMPWLAAFPLFLLLTGYQGLLFGLWAC